MQIYLVGGAVRDQMLGFPVKEKDWVVVGATVENMLQQGFRPVGKDFPVFLHPKTQEEYALARTERKIGKGYTGFQFNASPQVTLEEDLMRRDLTINAMAQDGDGHLIDPYHGQQDIEKKVLRHVSPAFVEDPVRILRVARFAARYKQFGFTVADETLELMRQMVLAGEVDALVAERVWKELERALSEKNPEVFFEVLIQCHAAEVLFPVFNLEALKKAVSLDANTQVRFAVLLSHLSEAEIKLFCERYRVPSDYRELALLVSKQLNQYQNALRLSASEVLDLLQAADAFRRENRFKYFLLACEAANLDPMLERDSNQIETTPSLILNQCYLAAKELNTGELLEAGFVGKELADQIKIKRIEKIATLLRE